MPKKKSLNEYSVDATLCIACETCVEIAPDNFAMKKKTAYVSKQPVTAFERSLCKDVMEACPVEAITNG